MARAKTRRLQQSEFSTDADWRRAIEQHFGAWCQVCGSTRDLEADHIMPRSQGGLSDLGNGMLLCRKCHAAKTAGRLKIAMSVLFTVQVQWLEDHDWVRWAVDGVARGRGCRHFLDRAESVIQTGRDG